MKLVLSPSLKRDTFTHPIEKGGFGGRTAQESADAIDLVTYDEVGRPYGVILATNDLKVSRDSLPSSLSDAAVPMLVGPLEVEYGQEVVYVISNYDSFVSYMVTAVGGLAIRAGEEIRFTAGLVAQTATLVINGRTYPVSIVPPKPARPTIVIPDETAWAHRDFDLVVGSAFSSAVTDSHASTDWQLAFDANFTLLTKQLTASTTQLTTWNLTDMEELTTYYLRHRHRGQLGGVSAWSPTVSFTTKSARYPQVEVQKLLPSDGAINDRFGYHGVISTDGRYIAIQAWYGDGTIIDAGAVYVYFFDGVKWVQQAKLTKTEGAANDFYGSRCAINADGSTLVVGAYGYDQPVNNAGEVYVYVRSGTTWSLQTRLAPSPAINGGSYGASVAISPDGNTMAIQAISNTTGVHDIDIFTRSGTTWSLQQKVRPAETVTGDVFGGEIAFFNNGNKFVASSHMRTANQTYEGVLYVFARTGGVWSQEARITADSPVAGDQMGRGLAVSADGSTIAAGSLQADLNSTDTGAIWIFVHNGTTWVQQQKIVPKDLANLKAGQRLSLSPDGNTLVVGLPTDNLQGTDTGSVYIYRRNAGVWTLFQTLVNNPELNSTLFGYEARIAGNNRIVALAVHAIVQGSLSGAAYTYVQPGSDPESYQQLIPATLTEGERYGTALAYSATGDYLLINAVAKAGYGQVYVYVREGLTWVQQSIITPSSPVTGDNFGGGIAVNGDATIALIGAPRRDQVGTDSGLVYVFTRSGTTWTQQQTLVSSDLADGDLFGTSVAMTHDGTLALIGASHDDNTGIDSGAVYVFTRSGSVWTQQQKLTSPGGAAYRYYGTSVAMNSDGTRVLIGAVGDTTKGAWAGAVHHYTRSGTTWTHVSKFTADDLIADDRFGMSVALSADGLTAMVGASYSDSAGTNAGAVYVFSWTGGVWTQTRKLISPSAAGQAFYGTAVGFIPSLGVAFVGENNTNNGRGKFFVYRDMNLTGTPTNWVLEQRLTAQGNIADARFGVSFEMSGDGNTLVISAVYDSDGGINSGSIYIYRRNGSVWQQVQRIANPEPAAHDNFGTVVAINYDGSYIAVGTPLDDDVASNSGSVHVYVRSNGKWTWQQKLLGEPVALSRFGRSGLAFSADGSTLVVAANFYSDSFTNMGTVHVFVRSGSSWSQQVRLVASDASASAFFGTSTALSPDGNTLAISDVTIGIYFYTRSGATWTFQQKISDPALAGTEVNRLAFSKAGTELFRSVPGDGEGAVYVYVLNAGTWTQTHRIVRQSPHVGEQFGRSIAVSEDGRTLVVGAPYYDITGAVNTGAVYVYTRLNSQWTEKRRLVRQVQEGNDLFGMIVTLSKDGTTAASATQSSERGALAGAVHIFEAKLEQHQQTALLRSDAPSASDRFGTNVAIAANANIAVIGMSDVTTTGFAFVYQKTGTVWQQVAKLQASDGLVGNSFGSAVAINDDGTTIAVSAPEKATVATAAGAIYVFVKSGASWIEQQIIIPSDLAAGDRCASFLSLSGDGSTLAIGVNAHTINAVRQGAVYIYTRTASVWTLQQKIANPNAPFQAQFGSGVSLSTNGNRLAIGAYNQTVNGSATVGAAYIYNRDGNVWTQETTFTPIGIAPLGQFGHGVSLSGDGETVAVVSYMLSNNGIAEAGAAYVYVRQAGIWSMQARLTQPDTNTGDRFGSWVSLSKTGNVLLVASHRDDDVSDNAGSAHVYMRSEHTWVRSMKLLPSEKDASQGFGARLAINGDGSAMIIGAASALNTNPGRAYIFEPRTVEHVEVGYTAHTGVVKTGTVTYQSAVSMSADGAIYVDGVSADAADAGAVYVYQRTNRTWSFEAKVISADRAAGDRFGISAAISADGSTLIAGAARDTHAGGTQAGSVYVYTKVGGVWTQQAKLTASDATASAFFGQSVAISADGNIAAIGAPQAVANQGCVYIFTRTGGVWSQQTRLLHANAGVSDQLGSSMSMDAAGETLAVSAHGTVDGGAIIVFGRTGSTWTQRARLTAADSGSSVWLGIHSTRISADGSTIAAGSVLATVNGQTYAGAVYIFVRTATGWVQQAKLTDTVAIANATFGYGCALSYSGSVLCVGGAVYAGATGSAHLFVRHGSTWVRQAVFTGSAAVASDLFGRQSAMSADAQILNIHSATANGGYGAFHSYM